MALGLLFTVLIKKREYGTLDNGETAWQPLMRRDLNDCEVKPALQLLGRLKGCVVLAEVNREHWEIDQEIRLPWTEFWFHPIPSKV